jgi:hypothetical protein
MLGLMVFAVAGKTLRDYEWPDGEHAGGVILVDWMFLAMGVVSVLLLVLQGFDFGQIGVPGRTALTWAYLVWGGVLLFVGIHDWLRLQSLRRSGHVTPRTKVHRESK